MDKTEPGMVMIVFQIILSGTIVLWNQSITVFNFTIEAMPLLQLSFRCCRAFTLKDVVASVQLI